MGSGQFFKYINKKKEKFLIFNKIQWEGGGDKPVY